MTAGTDSISRIVDDLKRLVRDCGRIIGFFWEWEVSLLSRGDDLGDVFFLS